MSLARGWGWRGSRLAGRPPDRDLQGHGDPSLCHPPRDLSSRSLGACRHFWQQPPSGSGPDHAAPSRAWDGARGGPELAATSGSNLPAVRAGEPSHLVERGPVSAGRAGTRLSRPSGTPARRHAAPRARNDHAVARATGSSPARSRASNTALPSEARGATASCVARLKPTVAVSSTGTTEATRPAVPSSTSEEASPSSSSAPSAPPPGLAGGQDQPVRRAPQAVEVVDGHRPVRQVQCREERVVPPEDAVRGDVAEPGAVEACSVAS
jgi:hypothetical protein